MNGKFWKVPRVEHGLEGLPEREWGRVGAMAWKVTLGGEGRSATKQGVHSVDDFLHCTGDLLV